MSMKKSELDKHLGKKVVGEAAAGLVPFACKLPDDLAATLREGAAAHEGGINGLVAELLRKGLS
jgi:hypothetical protein